jgi:polysaccharide pyruvyl transferase WcaK-like protein
VKIALVNSVLLNGGDAGIVYGTLDGIEQAMPQARVTVFAHHPAAAARYYPDLQLRPMLFEAWAGDRFKRAAMRSTFPFRSRHSLASREERSFLDAMSGSDAIVYCGGGYINESYNTKVVLDVIERTLDLGVPHMAYGHSIGPLYREQTRKRVCRLLNRFGAVSTRDEASHELLMRLGIDPARSHLLADAAFGMRVDGIPPLPTEEEATVEEVRRFRRDAGGSPVILFSVRDWKFPRNPDAAALTGNLRGELQRLLRRLI